MSAKSFFAMLALEVLKAAPQIIIDIEQDKSTFGTQDKTASAVTATLQADNVAKLLDPNDSEQADVAAEVTAGLITALKTPPPVAPNAVTQPAPAGS